MSLLAFLTPNEALEDEFPDTGPKKKRGGHNKLPPEEALRRLRERNRKLQARFRSKNKDKINEQRRAAWAKKSQEINRRRRAIYAGGTPDTAST